MPIAFPHLIPSDDFFTSMDHFDPPMFQLSTFIKRNGRRTFALVAIALSILGAIGLASASQNSTPMWSAIILSLLDR
jgi:hypothetical protein